MQQSKDFKLEILIYPSLNIEPLTPNIPYLPHSLTKLSNFVTLEALGRGLKLFFALQKWKEMCEYSTFFDFLSVHSLAYLPLTRKRNIKFMKLEYAQDWCIYIPGGI